MDSISHHGELDFTTKMGDKDFHRGGHNERDDGSPFHVAIQKLKNHMNGGSLEMGAVDDIANAKGRQHLSDMVVNDHELKGGNFLSTLGHIATTILPFLL